MRLKLKNVLEMSERACLYRSTKLDTTLLTRPLERPQTPDWPASFS